MMEPINPETISAVLGPFGPLENVRANWPLIESAWLETRGINSLATKIAAIAIVAVETGRFSPVRERGGPAYFTKTLRRPRGPGEQSTGRRREVFRPRIHPDHGARELFGVWPRDRRRPDRGSRPRARSRDRRGSARSVFSDKKHPQARGREQLGSGSSTRERRSRGMGSFFRVRRRAFESSVARRDYSRRRRANLKVGGK